MSLHINAIDPVPGGFNEEAIIVRQAIMLSGGAATLGGVTANQQTSVANTLLKLSFEAFARS
jgi:hypothetical protein